VRATLRLGQNKDVWDVTKFGDAGGHSKQAQSNKPMIVESPFRLCEPERVPDVLRNAYAVLTREEPFASEVCSSRSQSSERPLPDGNNTIEVTPKNLVEIV
jgi:hypothetical protein